MIELKAPQGKFRVIGVDTFDHTEWISGDFNTKEEAIKHAEKEVEDEEMLKMHIYDDKGKHLYDCGIY